MFSLKLTRALADASFNAMVLIVMEKDALSAAALKLQNASGGAPLSNEDLIREANEMLPKANDAQAMRLFFATQHQIEDGGLDGIVDLGRFIAERAEHLEQKATTALHDSQTAQGWTHALSALAEGYSYVVEAAENLQERGLVAMRRSREIEALTTRPDDNTHLALAALFDKASAFYEDRKAEGKSQLREHFR